MSMLAFDRGAQAARACLLDIEHCNRQVISKGGDLDILTASELIARHGKGSAAYQAEFRLAMAEFITVALDNDVITPETWIPLQYVNESGAS